MANLENIITEVIKPIEALLGTYGDSGLAAEAMYPALRRHTPAELRAATNAVLSRWTQRGKRPLATDIVKAIPVGKGSGEFAAAEAVRGAERDRIERMGDERRRELEAKYGTERTARAADLIEESGLERSWLSLERVLQNWDLIQAKIANGTWRK